MKWETGAFRTTAGGYPAIIRVDRIIAPQHLPFSEVQGEITSKYQEYLESEWIKQLKEKYTVKINYEVVEDVRKRLKEK